MTEAKPRRTRWRVTLYNPASARVDYAPYVNVQTHITKVEAEGSTMRRAFHRALTAAGAEFLTAGFHVLDVQARTLGRDYCGVAVNCFESARVGMQHHPATARIAVCESGFTVEIERVR